MEEKIRSSKLRKDAEEEVKNQFHDLKVKSVDVDEVIHELRVDEVIHELRVHQVELEMQNEELIEAQLKLEESRRKYLDLYNSAPIGYFTINNDGLIVDVNQTGTIFLGANKSEIIKSAFILYITPHSQHKFCKHIEKIKELGTIQSCDLELIKLNMPIHIESKGLFDENGNIKEILVAAIDITKQKIFANEIKESEKKFRALIYNSTDLIRILDQEGLIIFDSPSSTRILGYPEGYMIGKSPLEFIHPDDLEKVKKDLEDVYENRNKGIPTEFRIRKADGNYIYMESISMNMTNFPGIYGIVVTTHPIQQRKEMEDALRESEEKYRTLFEEDPDYTILIKPDGIISDVNNATTNLAGLSREELIGMHFSKLEIIPSEEMKSNIKKINALLKGENIKPFESRFIDKNGKTHWTLVYLTIVKKKDNILYILGIASDITKRKTAEDEIKSSLKEKNTLLREIHHRVKNNMQIISSLLNLQTEYVDDQEAVDVLKESQNRVKSMAMIHEKIYLSDDLTHINFVDYIQSLVKNLFYSYNVENAQIKSILEVENVNLNMETAVPCGLIISELVSNSLKHAFPNERKGEVYISLKSKEDKYELIIHDNGIGLPEKLDFNNLESLGLLLVNNLTEQIDGELTINRNHGTEFKIIFEELEYKERV